MKHRIPTPLQSCKNAAVLELKRVWEQKSGSAGFMIILILGNEVSHEESIFVFIKKLTAKLPGKQEKKNPFCQHFCMLILHVFAYRL